MTAATLTATSLGCVTFAALLLSVPILVSEINGIWTQLDADIAEFRGLSNDLWREMIKSRPGGVKPDHARARRQAYSRVRN